MSLFKKKSALLLLLLFTLVNCHNKKIKQTSNDAMKCICMDKILHYADTITFLNSMTIDNYFNKKNDSIFATCNFTDMRQDSLFKKAILKIVLKLDIYFSHREKNEIDIYPLRSYSSFANKLINEYSYLYFGKDINENNTELLYISSVRGFILHNKYYMKDVEINNLMNR